MLADESALSIVLLPTVDILLLFVDVLHLGLHPTANIGSDGERETDPFRLFIIEVSADG